MFCNCGNPLCLTCSPPTTELDLDIEETLDLPDEILDTPAPQPDARRSTKKRSDGHFNTCYVCGFGFNEIYKPHILQSKTYGIAMHAWCKGRGNL